MVQAVFGQAVVEEGFGRRLREELRRVGNEGGDVLFVFEQPDVEDGRVVAVRRRREPQGVVDGVVLGEFRVKAVVGRHGDGVFSEDERIGQFPLEDGEACVLVDGGLPELGDDT